MSQQNLISIEISEADIAEINSAIQVLQDKLLPHLSVMTPDERMELVKMGNKSVAFVQDAYTHSSTNLELVPPFLDMEEFSRDTKAVTQMHEIHSTVAQLEAALADTLMLAGSDAMSAALMFYNAVKYAKKSNVPKAEVIYNELSARWADRRKKSDKAEAEVQN